jgi:hypothetical protein
MSLRRLYWRTVLAEDVPKTNVPDRLKDAVGPLQSTASIESFPAIESSLSSPRSFQVLPASSGVIDSILPCETPAVFRILEKLDVSISPTLLPPLRPILASGKGGRGSSAVSVLDRCVRSCTSTNPLDLPVIRTSWKPSPRARSSPSVIGGQTGFAGGGKPSTGIRKFSCMHSGCGRTFERRGHLEEHVDSKHHNIQRFQCSICYRGFGHKSSWRRHSSRVHAAKSLSQKNPAY